MKVYIYKTENENNKLNKTLEIIKEVDIKLLASTDILKPVVELAHIPIEEITTANYMYIPDFNRYYFIDNIELRNNGNVFISGSVDVLMSYMDAILNTSGTVKRAESLKNGYIPDEHYKSISYSQIITKRFPNSMTQDSFILMTVG